MKLQLSAAILSSLTTGVVVLAQNVTIPVPAPGCVKAADCWCIPDEPTDPNATAVCPAIGSRIDVLNVTSTAPKVAFFESFAFNPYENGLFELDPPGCQPFPRVAKFFNLTECNGVSQGGYSTKSSKSAKSGYNQVCAFDYSGDICDGGSYGLYNTKAGKSEKEDSRMLKKAKKDPKKGKGKKDKKGAKKEKTSKGGITHESSCGVCSSAQDLVVLMEPLLLEAITFCAFQTAEQLQDPARAPTVLPDAIACHKALGFTDACATVWGSGSLATALEVADAAVALVPGSGLNYTGPASCTQCAIQCLSDPTIPACRVPFIGDTCELSPCIACQEEAIEPTFQQFSGRTRRRSGILGADIKRPCSKTANIDQPFVTCPVPTAAPAPVVPAPAPVVPAPDPVVPAPADPVVPAPDPVVPAPDPVVPAPAPDPVPVPAPEKPAPADDD